MRVPGRSGTTGRHPVTWSDARMRRADDVTAAMSSGISLYLDLLRFVLAASVVIARIGSPSRVMREPKAEMLCADHRRMKSRWRQREPEDDIGNPERGMRPSDRGTMLAHGFEGEPMSRPPRGPTECA